MRCVQVHGGLCVSAVFHFNQQGQVTRLTTADRPRHAFDELENAARASLLAASCSREQIR